MKTDLRFALSEVMNKEITKEEEEDVRKRFADGVTDDKICINTFMDMIDYLSESDSQTNRRRMIVAQKLLLLEVSENIDPNHRNLLGLKESKIGRARIKNVKRKKRPLINHDEDFKSAYAPHQMRCLALVSQGRTNETLRNFVISNKNLLKKFRLLGDEKTMIMLRNVYDDDEDVVYGDFVDNKESGYNKLVSSLKQGRVGGIVAFEDPQISAESQDFKSGFDQLRQHCLAKNIMIVNNPTTALMMVNTIRIALKDRKGELIPSLFLPVRHPSFKNIQIANKRKRQIHRRIDIERSLRQELLEVKEENKKLALDLKRIETTADTNNEELTSIVEGIMDVETKEASYILKQLQSRYQTSQRYSPIAVMEEVVSPHPLRGSGGSSIGFHVMKNDNEGHSIRNEEITAVSSVTLGGMTNSARAGEDSIRNGSMNIGNNVVRDIIEYEENITPTRTLEKFDVHIVGGSDNCVIEDCENSDGCVSEDCSDCEDGGKEFDTESVVYDFARPGTAGSQSISRIRTDVYSSFHQFANGNFQRLNSSSIMNDLIDDTHIAESGSIPSSILASPASSIASLRTGDFHAFSSGRRGFENSDPPSVLSIDSSGSVFSAFSRRDEAFANLKKRFQAFTNANLQVEESGT